VSVVAGPEGMSVGGPLFAVSGAPAEGSIGWQMYIGPLELGPTVGTAWGTPVPEGRGDVAIICLGCPLSVGVNVRVLFRRI
jgi:hypothetical protein